MWVKVLYHEDGLQLVQHGDMIDLMAAETVRLKKGEFKLISLGVSLEFPDGYYGKVYPRSSTFKNYGIIMVNSVGIIDHEYKGDLDIWKFPAYATRDTVIKKGDRIAQFEVVKQQEPVTFIPVETLGNVDRGGFGSSGK